MKNNSFSISRMKTMAATLLLIGGLLFSTASLAQNDRSIWKKTIIVTTIDGSTMEYLIDENTKVRVEKPYLVIETESTVLNYELDKMGRLRYGKRLADDGINEIADANPFTFDNETFYFEHLPENSIIEIFSANGKMVESRKCSGNTQVSVRSLTPGTYVVKANDDTYKILKK